MPGEGRRCFQSRDRQARTGRAAWPVRSGDFVPGDPVSHGVPGRWRRQRSQIPNHQGAPLGRRRSAGPERKRSHRCLRGARHKRPSIHARCHARWGKLVAKRHPTVCYLRRLSAREEPLVGIPCTTWGATSQRENSVTAQRVVSTRFAHDYQQAAARVLLRRLREALQFKNSRSRSEICSVTEVPAGSMFGSV